MGLDVETPDPPDLTNRGLPGGVDPDAANDGLGDLRRAELEEVLRDGAWSEGFREWAEYTDLTAPEYSVLREHGLFGEMDFYWDPTEGRVRYEPPALPPELSERRELTSLADTELSDLGDAVLETIDDGYLDWGGEPTDDRDWPGESFDDESPEDD